MTHHDAPTGTDGPVYTPKQMPQTQLVWHFDLHVENYTTMCFASSKGAGVALLFNDGTAASRRCCTVCLMESDALAAAASLSSGGLGVLLRWH